MDDVPNELLLQKVDPIAGKQWADLHELHERDLRGTHEGKIQGRLDIITLLLQRPLEPLQPALVDDPRMERPP